MKKNKIIVLIISLIVFILIIIFIFCLKQNKNNITNDKIQFISTEILLAGYVNEEITLPTIFVYNQNLDPKSLIEDVSLINSENMEISKWEIKDGKKYKDIKLNNISLELKITKEGVSDIKGLKILYHNGTVVEFKFDKFLLNSYLKKSSNFIVNSKESYIASYNKLNFDLKNISNNKFKLNELNLNSSDIILKNSQYSINNNYVKNLNNIEVAPNDIIDFKLEIDMDRLPVDLLFIRPYISYTLDNITYYEPITFGCIIGLPISDDKMDKIYNNYIQFSEIAGG